MTASAGGRTGRRPGAGDTREDILVAAREVFAERGYDGATVRRRGRALAGVDPALLYHYFGSKQQLFVAAMELPYDWQQVLPALLDGAARRDRRTARAAAAGLLGGPRDQSRCSGRRALGGDRSGGRGDGAPLLAEGPFATAGAG